MIDLHVHSSCSDGSDPPERVVELAVEAGCSSVALTDHDGLFGLVRAAARAAELGIGFVPGCEVSCTADPGTLHILCYFVEDRPSPIVDDLTAMRVDRAERNTEMLRRLAELGATLSSAEVAEEAGSDVVGRPHVAAVLVRHGYASSIDDAFTRYLAKGRPGYVGRAPVEAGEVVMHAARSGAVAVLAHPLSLTEDLVALDRTVGALAEVGLTGLECYYSRYDRDLRAELVRIAKHHRLVATGGSDFHGTYKPDLSIGIGRGDLVVPDEALEELRARHELLAQSSR